MIHLTRSDVSDTDRESSVHQVVGSDSAQSPHCLNRIILAIITQEGVENVDFRSRANGCLIHGSGKQLRIADQKERVVVTHFLAFPGIVFPLSSQVDFDRALWIGTQNQAEYLLPRP